MSNEDVTRGPGALEAVDAAIERVVRRHEATLASLRETIRFASLPAGAPAGGDDPVTWEPSEDPVESRDREIAALRCELDRVRQTALERSSEYAREETARARVLFARAQAAIRAQAREIERLAAELADRS